VKEGLDALRRGSHLVMVVESGDEGLRAVSEALDRSPAHAVFVLPWCANELQGRAWFDELRDPLEQSFVTLSEWSVGHEGRANLSMWCVFVSSNTAAIEGVVFDQGVVGEVVGRLRPRVYWGGAKDESGLEGVVPPGGVLVEWSGCLSRVTRLAFLLAGLEVGKSVLISPDRDRFRGLPDERKEVRISADHAVADRDILPLWSLGGSRTFFGALEAVRVQCLSLPALSPALASAWVAQPTKIDDARAALEGCDLGPEDLVRCLGVVGKSCPSFSPLWQCLTLLFIRSQGRW
jgi:hypothetical protein